MAIVVLQIERLLDAGRHELRLVVNGRAMWFGIGVWQKGRSAGLGYDGELSRLLIEHERQEIGMGSTSRDLGDLMRLLTDADKGRAVPLPFTFGTDQFPEPRKNWWRWWGF